jgi:hypothetical protein
MNMLARTPDRGLQVAVNPAMRKIQLMMLAHGHPIPMAAIEFTVEQAESHIQAMRGAIDAIKASKAGLLLPPDMGAPFQP